MTLGTVAYGTLAFWLSGPFLSYLVIYLYIYSGHQTRVPCKSWNMRWHSSLALLADSNCYLAANTRCLWCTFLLGCDL
jgi:hypothetical protein